MYTLCTMDGGCKIDIENVTHTAIVHSPYTPNSHFTHCHWVLCKCVGVRVQGLNRHLSMDDHSTVTYQSVCRYCNIKMFLVLKYTVLDMQFITIFKHMISNGMLLKVLNPCKALNKILNC